MRALKLILTTLVLGGLVVPSLSCGSESDEAGSAESQIVTVQRGDLRVDITAVGNLALSRTEDLAFEIAGTVEEVLVEEGETVEEGQALAKLDTSEWEDNLEILGDKLTAAERQISSKELDVLQAQINVQTAEDNLDDIEEVKEAQDAVDDAEFNLRIAQEMWKEGLLSGSTDKALTYWKEQIDFAKERLADAQEELREVLSGSSVVVTTEVATEVAMKKLQVEIAQRRLEDAQIAVDDAGKAVDDAQEALDEALEDSPQIIAPFDGFITKVNVEGGDEVLKGTVAVQLADPNKFEADVMVSEMDIFQVKLGGEATVQLDAMSTLILPAEVTHISPTATIQQGVVNYRVKVEIEPLQSVLQEQQEARQQAMERITSGELPERLQQAIEEGRITREQAEEMIKQMQQGQGGQQGQVPTAISEDFQLREGLTATVSIIIQEKNDVLLVPNSAITTQDRQTFVQVLLPDGTLEERAITTGITDYQNTEVIDGLSEGEQVVVPQGTTTTSTTQQGPPGGPMPFFGPPR